MSGELWTVSEAEGCFIKHTKHTIAGAEYSQPVPGVRLIKARSFEQEVAESEGRGGVMWLAWSGGDLAWLTGQTLEVR